jgi:hypothetical protein
MHADAHRTTTHHTPARAWARRRGGNRRIEYLVNSHSSLLCLCGRYAGRLINNHTYLNSPAYSRLLNRQSTIPHQ